MEFEWNLSIDHISIFDDKNKKWITLTETGSIIYGEDDKTWEFDFLEFDHIAFWEPKLLKAGIIAFYENEEDEEPAFAILVSKKYKTEFYMIFNVLEENGLDVIAY